jgi:hypothetical protein
MTDLARLKEGEGSSSPGGALPVVLADDRGGVAVGDVVLVAEPVDPLLEP